jgi:hypothetical protein
MNKLDGQYYLGERINAPNTKPLNNNDHITHLSLRAVHLGKLALIVFLHALGLALQLLVLLVLGQQLLVVLLVQFLHLALMPTIRSVKGER